MKALAFSNNDIAVIAWTYDQRLKDCLGFAIYRCDPDGSNPVPLSALARFASTPRKAKLTTEQAPVQKFWWKDLAAKRGSEHVYKIVPMSGAPGALAPMNGVAPLLTNKVKLTEDRGRFKAYFNRGIVSTQALTNALGGKPSQAKLKGHIQKANDPLRLNLMGQLYEGATLLLDRADKNNGEIRAALYELDDPEGFESRLQAKSGIGPAKRHVILGNEWDTKNKIEDVCARARQDLNNAGLPVIDRILPSGQIPHNKFVVLLENGQPQAVLTGSTNWTSSGLCSQTNNALVIESPRIAQQYLDYWDELHTDTSAGAGGSAKIQGKTLRDWNHAHNQSKIADPTEIEDKSATIELMLSPNTPGLLGKNPKAPDDMGRLFELVKGAKQAVLFLAFDPGNNSILDAAAQALNANPDLFVRGALTNAQRASNFTKALDGPGDQRPRGKKGFEVAVIGEAGKPKKASSSASNSPPVDYRAVAAGAVDSNDKFGAWEAELYKAGFAIIHNKVVVIDPFSDHCVVITGSHNLGYRASHNNDENMVIIHGHRPLAEAYACHVLDLYDHYAWRYWLKKSPDIFGRPLDETDKWQDRYIKDDQEKSPELRFWLSAEASNS